MVNVQDSGEFILNIAQESFFKMLEDGLQFTQYVIDKEISE